MKNRLGLSPVECARTLGVSPTQIRRAIAACNLLSHKIGVRSVVLAADLDAWVRARPARRPKTSAESCTVA